MRKIQGEICSVEHFASVVRFFQPAKPGFTPLSLFFRSARSNIGIWGRFSVAGRSMEGWGQCFALIGVSLWMCPWKG